MKVMLLFFEEEDEEIFLKVQRLIQSAISTDEFHVSTHQFVSKTLEIQTDQRRVFCQGREVFLTITEYEILLYLFKNPNRVLTYSQIYERVWREPDYGEARKLVSHHVQAIRRKLKLKEEAAICLRCVREVGYSLRME